MKKAGRIVSFDWSKYDQGQVVYRPAQMSAEQLRRGHYRAYREFYGPRSIAGRFPLSGKRARAQWAIYNLFMRKSTREETEPAPGPSPEPDIAPMPPILPIKREWRAAVLDAAAQPAAGGATSEPA
jgi:hypothetical protein